MWRSSLEMPDGGTRGRSWVDGVHGKRPDYQPSLDQRQSLGDIRRRPPPLRNERNLSPDFAAREIARTRVSRRNAVIGVHVYVGISASHQ